MKTPPIRNLKGLQLLKLQIESRAKLAKELELAAKAAAARIKAEKELFSLAVGPVKALPFKHRPGHRAQLVRAQPAPIAVQRADQK